MGMSSRARLAYGYALGGDEDSDGWLIEEASEYGEWEPDWQGEDGITEAAEARMLASVGFTETDWEVDGYFDRQRDAKARLGVKFVHHGGEWSCVVLATHETTVEWGEVAEIDFATLEQLQVEGDWNAKLAHAVKTLGITPKQASPRWLLVAAYG